MCIFCHLAHTPKDLTCLHLMHYAFIIQLRKPEVNQKRYLLRQTINIDMTHWFFRTSVPRKRNFSEFPYKYFPDWEVFLFAASTYQESHISAYV